MLYIYLFIISWLEFNCPGDGLCSNNGICDSTSGSCVCNEGFEGNMCQGKYSVF